MIVLFETPAGYSLFKVRPWIMRKLHVVTKMRIKMEIGSWFYSAHFITSLSPMIMIIITMITMIIMIMISHYENNQFNN
jgi:hypothetical protein